MINKPEKLFVTHSPYHTILAYSIASNTNRDSSIFIQPYIPNDSIWPLIELFRKTDQFSHVRLLPGLYTDYGKKKEDTVGILDNNIHEISEYIQNRDLEEVCVSLDDRDIDQAAVYYAKSANQNVTCSILEDGLGAYRDYSSSWNPHAHPLLHTIRQLVIHKFIYQRNIPVYGDSKYISQIHTTFPTLLRSHYKDFTKRGISPRPVIELGNSEECSEYLEESGLDIEKLADIDILILPPKVDSLDRNSEKTLLSELLSELNSFGLTPGIKYHPRQRNTSDVFEEAVIIPQSVPAELVLVHPRTDIQTVASGISTVFLSANWLLNEINVVSIDYILPEPHSPEMIDDELDRTLKSLGITFPDTIDRFLDIIL